MTSRPATQAELEAFARSAADQAWQATTSLLERGDALVEAMDIFVRALHRTGARDSDDRNIRHFSAYHLASLEGNDGGAMWLASGLLADELRRLLRDLRDDRADDEVAP